MTPLIKQKHDITFSESGRIDLTKKVTELLHLKCGDYINFSCHDDEFYVYKSTYGIKLYPAKNGISQGFLRGSNKMACLHILQNTPLGRFRVGEISNIKDELMLPIIKKNYAAQY